MNIDLFNAPIHRHDEHSIELLGVLNMIFQSMPLLIIHIAVIVKLNMLTDLESLSFIANITTL